MTFTSFSKDSFAALRANGSLQLWQGMHAFKQVFGKYQCTGVVHNVFESVGSSDDDEWKKDATQQPQQKGRPIALDAFMEKERVCAADSLGNIAVLSTSTFTTSMVASYSPFAKQASATFRTPRDPISIPTSALPWRYTVVVDVLQLVDENVKRVYWILRLVM